MKPSHQTDPKILEMARLSYSEIEGRLLACDILMEQTMTIDDPEMQYGLTTATQELLLRTGEASLKMLFMLEFDKEPDRDHDLKQLWERLSPEMRREFDKEYQEISPFPEGAKFNAYNKKDFQRARYPYEYITKGEKVALELPQVTLECYAALSIARRWLGDTSTWAWVGKIRVETARYSFSEENQGTVSVHIHDNDHPMANTFGIIRRQESGFEWSLYYSSDPTKLLKLPKRLYSSEPGLTTCPSAELAAAILHHRLENPTPELLHIVGVLNYGPTELKRRQTAVEPDDNPDGDQRCDGDAEDVRESVEPGGAGLLGDSDGSA